MIRTALGLLIVAIAAVTVAVATAAGAGSNRVRGYGEVPVKGAAGTRYVLRTTYAVPGSWKPIGRRRAQKITHRFGPIGSCRIRVTISGVAVADPPEDSVARVTRLLPGTGRGLLDHGT